MALPVPNLDDRTFDQLVTEARSLIPKNFPKWTDHNPSDPGITLLELFAFLTEIAIYQTNRIPERSLPHFAELVGVTQQSGEPIEQTLHRALAALALKYRAVTADEFETLAKQSAPSAIARSKVIVEEASNSNVFPPDQIVKVILVVTLLADFTFEPEQPHAGQPIQFQNQSTSNETSELSWFWDFGDRSGSSNQKNLTHIYQAAGNYSVKLTISDQNRHSNSRVYTISVLPAEKSQPDEPHQQKKTALAELHQTVFAFLRTRCQITTRVQVIQPEYTPITIAVTIVRDLTSRLDKDTVQNQVEQAIRIFLSPLVGGVSQTGWEFGRSVFRSELYQLMEEVSGVDHVQRLLLNGDDERNNLPLSSPISLVTLDHLTVTVVDPRRSL